jgi:hypothetical protein
MKDKNVKPTDAELDLIDETFEGYEAFYKDPKPERGKKWLSAGRVAMVAAIGVGALCVTALCIGLWANASYYGSPIADNVGFLTAQRKSEITVMRSVKEALDGCDAFDAGIKDEAKKTGSGSVDAPVRDAKFRSWYNSAVKIAEAYPAEGQYLHHVYKDADGNEIDLGVSDEDMFQDASSAGKIQYVWQYAYDYVISVIYSTGSALAMKDVSINGAVVISTPDSDPTGWDSTYQNVTSKDYYTYDVYKTLRAFDSGEYLNKDNIFISGKPTLADLRSQLNGLCRVLDLKWISA